MDGVRKRRPCGVRRATTLATVVALFLAIGSSGSAKQLDVVFTALPAKAFEGQKLTISVFVQPRSPRCLLTMRYKGGRTDRRRKPPNKGKASWTFRVPAVPPGLATVTVSCTGAGSISRTLLVQWALQAPKLTVDKLGFSQRPSFGNRSDVSYGLALRNERTRFDALDVAVLVNFVDSDNRVLGTAHAAVHRVPAGATFYVGGHELIASQNPIARLEPVIGPAKSAQKAASLPPLVSDVVIVSDNKHEYVDSVRGQLLNRYRGPMQWADVGIVVVDSAGNIVGGGFNRARGPLAYGAREFFSATFSFAPIPASRAAAALVSPVPNYPPPP